MYNVPFAMLRALRGLNPIQLGYNPTLAGWPARLTASAFNRLGQYA